MYPDLKPGKHLLFDNVPLADTHRLRRRLHQPVRDPQKPILTAEKPWDGASVTPLHVMYDPVKKLHRMWYQAHDPKVQEERTKLGRSKYGNVGEPQPIYLCYSESHDGVTWNRPGLGIYKHKGEDTNICFKGFSYVAGNTFIFRPDAPAEERYLMINCEWATDQKGGIYIARSPDGIHWKYPDDEPLIFGESDTWNSLVYNPERKVFMVYMRGWHCAAVNWPVLKKGNPRRRVAYSESRDLKTWSEPQVILTPDELDTNDFYGFQVFKYANYYIGQLWIYDEDDRDTMEVELAWSQDGILWSRLPERPRFLQVGRDGEPDAGMVIPAQEPVVMGDELHFYSVGHRAPHNASDDPGSSSVGFRARLRMDGFISVSAGSNHGALLTRPFVVHGEQITINATTRPSGEIIAELVEPYFHEPEGKPIEGFAAKDFDVFRGDSVAHPLSWKGNSNLKALKGKRVMLRMLLRHSDIYSLAI